MDNPPANRKDAAAVLPSERITIRAAEPADAHAISALMGSHGVLEGTLQMPYAAIASRVEHLSKHDANGVKLVAVVPAAQADGVDRIIGFASLFSCHNSLRRQHARGLAITVDAQWQGRGVGDQLMTALLDWADRWAGVLRIELTVFTDNTKATALYQRHGFVPEGVLRAFALRDGVYVDALAMARLHPQPPSIPKI
jgi:L-phenylalanine/L-methionine N-acetyltransferase